MKRVIGIVVMGAIPLFLMPYFGNPTHDRVWADPYARTPNAVVATSTVTLKNVRTYTHSATTTVAREWQDEVAIPVEQIESLWFGLARFGRFDAVGHTFLSFELDDGRVYTLSIEARREPDETYSALKGLFNRFELWYGWGTEQDFLGISLITLNRPLEYYRLKLTPAEAQAVFRSVALETAAVAKEPRFYNTFRGNCTNLLAKAVNSQYPDRLPYGLAWNLPGRSVQYLWDEGLIDETIPAADHPERARINANDTALRAAIAASPEEFSTALRAQFLAPE